MNAALWISKTGLSAEDAEMSAIANNIANVNTNGFKRDRVMFQDLFYQFFHCFSKSLQIALSPD